ncbi:MAG: hypothetical protein ACREVY_00690 [Gammaproteobacteria bacterium]
MAAMTNPKRFVFAPDYVGGPALGILRDGGYEFGDGDCYAPDHLATACNVGRPVHYLTMAELEEIVATHFSQTSNVAHKPRRFLASA